MSEPANAMATLAQGGRATVGGFIIRLIARIPFLIVAAQWYGAVAMGRLAFAVAVVEFLAQISTLGLKRGLALHMSDTGRENGAWDAFLVVLFATLLPTLTLMLFPQLMFPNSEINRLDYLIPLAIPALALSDVTLAALAFRGDIQSTVRARAVIEPWIISIIAVALWPILPRDGMLVAYAASTIAALVASLIPFVKRFGWPRGWRPKPLELYALARANAPLVAAEAIEWSSRRLDLFLLGLFASPAMVGIYWVAQQIASLPLKLKTSFDPALGPVITKSLAEGDRTAVANQISRVGFWILAVQAGLAIILALWGERLMALIGPARDYVNGTGALTFLLFAEVAAVQAVVSEAALVYVARFKNLMLSLLTISLQGAFSIAGLLWLKANAYPEGWLAAWVAASLAASLLIGSFFKARLAHQLLDAPVRIWAWSILIAGLSCVGVFQLVKLGPNWAAFIIGLPTALALYCWIVWQHGFDAESRALFRKTI